MAQKFCTTGVLDSLFAYLYTANGNLRIVVMNSCEDPPTTIANASSDNNTHFIAQSTHDGFVTTDYFTIGSSGNNRYCTIGACSCDTVRNSLIASYVCLIDDSSSIRYVTTCTTQSLTAGNKVNIGTWTITVNQPT